MFPVVLIAAVGFLTVLLIVAFFAVRLSRIREKYYERQEETLRSLPPLAHRIRDEVSDNRRMGCGLILAWLVVAIVSMWGLGWLAFGLPFNQAGNKALLLAWPAFWAIIGLWSLSTTFSNWRSCLSCGRVHIQLPRTDDERNASRLAFVMLGILGPFAWNEYANGRVEAAAAILFSWLCIGLQSALAYRRGVAFTETGILAAGRHYPWADVTEWEWSTDRSTLAIAVTAEAGRYCIPGWLEHSDQADELERLLVESTQ